jgi:hypothetical protein
MRSDSGQSGHNDSQGRGRSVPAGSRRASVPDSKAERAAGFRWHLRGHLDLYVGAWRPAGSSRRPPIQTRSVPPGQGKCHPSRPARSASRTDRWDLPASSTRAVHRLVGSLDFTDGFGLYRRAAHRGPTQQLLGPYRGAWTLPIEPSSRAADSFGLYR